MKPIKVIENYYSKLLCAYLNTPALTLGSYIFLGCYQNKIAILKKALKPYFKHRKYKIIKEIL